MCEAAEASILAIGNYLGDGAVPEVSARFTDFVSGKYYDKQPWSTKLRTYKDVSHVSIHDDTKVFTQNPDGSDGGLVKDLLNFVPPVVNVTSIINGATGVSVNTAASSTFSEAIDASTLNTSTFILSGPSGLVVGTVTDDAATNTATFTPSVPLAYDTTYTATITTGVKDQAGNPLAANYSWSFTTGSSAATPPDTVIDSSPPASTTSTAATFTFHSTPSGGTFECKLDSGSYVACSSPLSYSNLAIGSHTFLVRTTNAAGTDASPASSSWSIGSSRNDQVSLGGN